MSQVESRCVIECGPYKGYRGHAIYDQEEALFDGEVIGVTDVITFQGQTPQEAVDAFCLSVDEYLAFCAEENRPPQSPGL